MTSTQGAVAGQPVSAEHSRRSVARVLFEQVLEELEAIGWVRYRVDSLRRETDSPHDRGALTIRHHYDHGCWELYLEPMKQWHPDARPYATVKIDSSKPLPTLTEVMAELSYR